MTCEKIYKKVVLVFHKGTTVNNFYTCVKSNLNQMRDAPGYNIKWKLFTTWVHKSWKPGYQATKFCTAMACILGS